ncbi:MAG: DUF4870 domain-containing protein [Lutibacter sp.]|uniref:DUF4870 domain-containing protein n=1 Tax=Lutibacter sp. TaxID=1925666 RepID=UPI00299D8D2F|nr:DUF4870 domain-containing protein [Lutibacter sp.]MDX1829937.1 DUF4870 domain-containing protein [Lutibacter sp.]
MCCIIPSFVHIFVLYNNKYNTIMITTKNTSTAFLIHISALASYIFPFGGVIAPLIIWQVKKDESNYIDEQGKAAVNFNLSFALYSFVAGLTAFSTFFFHFPNFIGLFGSVSLVAIISIIRLILIIIAAIKVNNNEYFKYPLTIQFIK